MVFDGCCCLSYCIVKKPVNFRVVAVGAVWLVPISFRATSMVESIADHNIGKCLLLIGYIVGLPYLTQLCPRCLLRIGFWVCTVVLSIPVEHHIGSRYILVSFFRFSNKPAIETVSQSRERP